MHESFIEAISDFPDISAYWRTSLLPLMIAKVMGVETVGGWVALHVLATAFLLVGTAIALLRRMGDEYGVVAFGLFVLGPIGAVLFGGIGFYDVWVIAGAVLLVAGKSWIIRIIGSVVLLGGNFELGCIALLGYVIWIAAQGSRKRLQNTIVETGFSIAAVYALLAWVYRSAPDPDSRGEWFVNQAKGSMVNAIVVFPLLAFSFFGVTWLLIGRHIIERKGMWPRALVFISLVMLPGVMAMTTLDGTRVFVAIAAPATVAVLFSADTYRAISGVEITPRNLAIAALVIPTLQVHMGEIINPYAELYGRLNLF